MNWKPKWTTKERYLSLDDFEGEIWKHFTHWRGCELKDYYYISNLGRLKSLCPYHKPKILPGTASVSHGNYIESMVRTKDDSQVNLKYHKAVAEYFLKYPEDGIDNYVVDHIDSDKHNNRVTNLQWLTRANNSRKAIKDGLCPIFVEVMGGKYNCVPCYFIEYPELRFKSMMEASYYIGRNSDYVAECIRLGREIKDKHTGQTLHIITEEKLVRQNIQFRTT